MTPVTWLLILTGVGMNAAAQLLLKSAARPLSAFTVFNSDTLMRSAVLLACSAPFWAGMMCYAASVCVWIAALSRAPVSVAYPMLSLGYVVVAAISAVWLGESLSVPQVLGIALICAGVLLVSRSTV
jgi:multidrug transporter EmrE-like cation transporter